MDLLTPATVPGLEDFQRHLSTMLDNTILAIRIAVAARIALENMPAMTEVEVSQAMGRVLSCGVREYLSTVFCPCRIF